MLSIENLTFAYQEKTILKGINLSIIQGKQVALIGESGAGKSTLLSLIHGNLLPQKGEILWNSEKILDPKKKLVAAHDNIKYLTQEFNVMPYTSVSENIKAPLSRMYPKKNQKISRQLLEVVGLEDYADTKVNLLSGGQKQRVALAKVLAKTPDLLLLDEPFSHIDVHQRNQLRRNLFAYLKQKGITCLFATHDPDDFLSFGDDCLVLRAGEIIDYRPMQQVYHSPKTKYTASLLGEMNIINGKMLQLEAYLHNEEFVVYPHEISVTSEASLKAKIHSAYFKGNHYLIEAFLANKKVYFTHSSALPEQTISSIKIEVDLAKRKLN